MRRHTSKDVSYSLYAAGLATVLCGLTALNSVVSDSSFSTTATLMLVLGYSVSIVLRRLGYTARIFELAVVAAAIALYVQLIGGQSALGYFVPSSVVETPELRLATMLLWLEVLRSFTLVSDESVVFSSIPSVVLISLASTNNVNVEILIIFFVYLLLTALLLSHRPGTHGSAIRKNIKLSIAVVVVALTVGMVVAIPVKFVCMRAFAKAMPQFIHAKQRLSLAGYSDTDMLQIAQGPVQLSDETIMTVKSHLAGSRQPISAYWRGKVFDRYTGHGWQISAAYQHVRPRDPVPEPFSLERENRFVSPEKLHGTRIEQTILVKTMVSREVFSAAEPVEVKSTCKRLERNAFNCWQGIYGRRALLSYSVTSVLPPSDLSNLREASADYPSDIKTLFLQRVLSTSRTGYLARRITKGIRNPYDKAAAIQEYLGRECVYDLNAAPTPKGSDPVDYFLFTSRVGYCDVFASSMVVMCREVGIPARLATGFMTGEYEADRDQFRVRELDRHAWAELYFPGCGWVTFDPTESTQVQGDSYLQAMVKRVKVAIGGLFGGSSAVLFASILLAICLAVVFSSDLKSIRLPRRHNRLERASLAEYRAVRRTLHVADIHLTPIESVDKSASLTSEAREVALQAAKLFSEIRYGNRAVTEADVEELRRLSKLLRSFLRASRR